MRVNDRVLALNSRWLPRALLAGLLIAAFGSGATAAPPPAGAPPHGGARYFVDFRARPSGYIGHTFVVYGRIDGSGRTVKSHVVGLIPERAPWRGLFFPITGTVRQYRDDVLMRPTTVYRRIVSAGQYARVAETVREMHAGVHRWHAIFLNCNDFAIAIAEAIGLWRPPSLLPPDVWVGGLRVLNER